MVSLNELLEHVDSAFDARPAEIAGWADPYPDRSPEDDAYSRVTNPERWCIVAARVDAWIHALTSFDVASVREVTGISWSKTWFDSNFTGRTELIIPSTPGTLTIVIARLEVNGLPNAGIVVGAGDPAEELVAVPDCGCDACDSGSDDALEQLDELLVNVISGTFRRLSRGKKSVTKTHDGMQASNMSRRETQRALERPKGKGWTELTGPSWLA